MYSRPMANVLHIKPYKLTKNIRSTHRICTIVYHTMMLALWMFEILSILNKNVLDKLNRNSNKNIRC